ncbi:MAG: ABC transporter permease [Chloroflexota bacterium]|jgi:Cu-processing system permease protein
MNMLIISQLTIREAQRRKLLWVAVLMGIAFLLVFGIGFHYIQREILRYPPGLQQERIIYAFLLTAGMYATNLLVTIVAVLVSVTTISGEIDSHTIDAIVTKPIRRWEVVIGKWLAFALLILTYLLALSGGLMLLVYAMSGYRFEEIIPGLLMMSLAALLVLSLSIAGGTRLSTLANGVLVFMLFSIAYLGGLIEQIGSFIRNEAAVNIGIVTSLIMPADALWKKALSYLQPREFNSPMMAGPFAATTEPSGLMVAYAILYLIGLMIFAVWSFTRRDL